MRINAMKKVTKRKADFANQNNQNFQISKLYKIQKKMYWKGESTTNRRGKLLSFIHKDLNTYTPHISEQKQKVQNTNRK